MVITNYQVQSVLRTYTRELQRSKLSDEVDRRSENDNTSEEKVTISSEGQRRYMMDRMTSQVLEKMYQKQENDVRPARNESTVDDAPVTEGI